MRRIFVTISERSSGGKESADSLREGFLEMPCNLKSGVGENPTPLRAIVEVQIS